MRSLLFVPGDTPRKLEKGFASAADVILIDLEDSVAPDRKNDGRSIVAGFLAEHGSARTKQVHVRVNGFDTRWLDDDLAAVMPAAPAGIMLPKTEGLAGIERLSVKLRVLEARNGLVDGSTRILPIATETATGLMAMPSFAGGHRRLCGITWGAEDLSADLGARANRDERGHYTDVFRLARTQTLLAAAAAGVAAIDTVFVDFRDSAGLRRECLEAERDGFVGKLAIHPDQVEIINAAFTPSQESIDEARAIVDTFAEAGNPGVIGIGGKMYDRPHLRRAERILARAAVTDAQNQPVQGPE